MAVSFGAIGTLGVGTTSCAPTYPVGISATTSVLIACVGGESSFSNIAISAPAGWTSLVQLEGGTGSLGTDTGPRRIAFFRKDTVLGSETGTQTFSFSSGSSTSTISGHIVRLDKTAGFSITTQVASGADTTHNTAYSATASASLTWATDDLLCIGVCENVDTAAPSAISIAASGVTFGTRSNRVMAAVGNGNDHRRILDTVPVSIGGATAAATYAYTASENVSGPTAFLLVRETAVDITLALAGSRSDTSIGSMVALSQSHGQVATFAQGTLTPGPPTKTLVGSGITSGQGTLTAVGAESHGQAMTLSQGTMTPGLGLIGQQIAGSKGPGGALSLLFLGGTASYQGAPRVTIRPTDPVGQVIAVAAGTLLPSGLAGSAHLSGVEAIFVAGVIDGGQRALSGQALAGGTGAYALTTARALSGVEAGLAAGALSPEQDAVDTWILSGYGAAVGAMAVAMVGAESSAAQGDVGLSADADQPMVGAVATAAAGTLVASPSIALLGAQCAAAQESVGAPGIVQLSGAELTAVAGDVFLTGDRTYALVGLGATLQDGITFASSLAFPPGQEITMGQGDLGPRTVALVGQDLRFLHGVLLALPPVVPIRDDAFGGGWAPPVRRRTKEDIRRARIEAGIIKPDLVPVVAQAVKAIAALPAKPRRKTITLEDLIGKKAVAKADNQDIAAIERAMQRENAKRREDEEADEITLLLD
jgi:hypothetical protein